MGEWNPPIPWRQGNFLTADAMASLKLVEGFDPALHVGVVVTHDCDLAHGPDAEPAVEVIVGRRVVPWDPQQYGNYTHSKNPRLLVLPAKEAGTAVWIELKATEKRSVLKAALGSAARHKTFLLDPADVITLQHWLASRYLRSAFPDAFNNLLRQMRVGERLESILRRQGRHILAVFFKFDERTQLGDPPFTLSIRLLYSTAEDFDAAEAEANSAARDITSAFRRSCFNKNEGTWEGIELKECLAIPDGVLTYKQSQQYKRWHADHISLRPGAAQSMLEE